MRPRMSPYTGFALCFSSFLAGIGYGVTAPRAPPGFRAAPRAVFAVTAIRLQSRTPSRLRRCALRLRGRLRPAARGGACGATPGLAAAGCAKACRPRRWRFAACTSRRTVHRHAARPPYGASTPRLKHVAASCGKGRSRLSLGVLALPAPERKPGQPSRGDAESAMSPFGTGGPCVLALL